MIAGSAGPNPPSHAVEITAQSINDSLDSACNKRAVISAATIATTTDKVAIA